MRILFEKSNTNIGKLGRFVDTYPYTHVSISFDNENYFSFSRRKHHNPFDSGFMIEKMNYYAYEDVQLKVYEVDVNKDKIEKIYEFINEVKDYPFDIYGMIKMYMKHPREKTNAYNCMSFVSRILQIIEIPLIKKNYYENNIEDIENALINYGLKAEILKVNKMENNDGYMDKVSIFEILKSFIEINKKLLKK